MRIPKQNFGIDRFGRGRLVGKSSLDLAGLRPNAINLGCYVADYADCMSTRDPSDSWFCDTTARLGCWESTLWDFLTFNTGP
jgi:hypothetical protein